MTIRISILLMAAGMHACAGGDSARDVSTLPTVSDPATTESPLRCAPQGLEAHSGFLGGKIRLDLPAAWTVHHQSEEALLLSRHSVDFPGVNPSIRVTVIPSQLPGDPDSLALIDAVRRGFTQVPGFELLEESNDQNAGGAWWWDVHYRFVAEGDLGVELPVESRVLMIDWQGELVVVAMMGARDGDDRCDSTFKAVRGSLVIE